MTVGGGVGEGCEEVTPQWAGCLNVCAYLCVYACVCVCARRELQQPRFPSLQICGCLINMDGALSLLDSGASHFMTINDFNELG